MTELPAGVLRLVAMPGELTLAFANHAAFASARLWVGDSAAPLQRLEAYDGPGADLFSPAMMDALSVDAVAGRRPFAEVDVTPEWTIAGGRTLFVRLDGAQLGQAFHLTNAGEASLPAREGHRVECLVAAHRMSGALHLDFQDRAGSTKVRQTIPIDPAMVGGRSSAKHGAVSEAVPTGLQIDRVAMTVEVTDLPPGAATQRPYVFLSNLRICARAGAEQLVPYVVEAVAEPSRSFEAPAPSFPLRVGWRLGLAGEAAADGGAALLDGGAGSKPAAPVFARAPLPRLSGADAVTLRLGGVRHTLPLPDAPPVKSVGLSAPRWLVSSAGAGDASLFVDGAFQGLVALDAGSNSLAIPREAMDGGEHTLELKDAHALRTLAADIAVLPRVLTPYPSLQSLSRRPLPMGLAPQAAARYAALEAALLAAPAPEEARELAHAHRVLGIGFDHLRPGDVRALAFPVVEAPDVSVVIPAHNRFPVTYACLCALRLARCEARFEVVLVDDGSTDETRAIEEVVSGLTVVRHDAPQRFIRACNAGVVASRGRYVVLLNNDTEPTVGWLDALMDPFTRFADVGVTGAMLVYPGNQLQDAGGLVFASGNPANYGRGGLPNDPRYRYVREAAYVSGAALMTSRAVWDEVGGLSAYLEPMYFEDTDFAFKVRATGRKVMYAPHALVYHYEGQTAGTDTTTGFKAYQEVNRPKFKEQWGPAFADLAPEDGDADRAKDFGARGRVLFVDQHVPRGDQDAGSVATLGEMALVQALGFKVTYLPYSLAALGGYVDDLERQGIETITAPFYLSPAEFLRARGSEFDAVFVYRHTLARRLIDRVREFAPNAKLVFVTADLSFLRQIRAARLSGDAAAMAEAITTREAELDVVARTDLTLSYSAVEDAVLMSHVAGVRVARCPFVAEPAAKVPGFHGREGAMVLASLRNPPNVDAIRWFVGDVWPEVTARTGAHLHLYGAGMPPEMRVLAGATVSAHGYVEDPMTAYARHLAFVAPQRASAGIAAKVIGAMAAGVPCVISPLAAEGLGVQDGTDCLVAETPAAWAEAIATLTADEAAWQAISAAGRAYVARHHSRAAGEAAMARALRDLGLLPAEAEPQRPWPDGSPG